MVPVLLHTMEGTLRMFFSDRIGRKSVPKSVLLNPKDYSQIGEINGPILQLGEPGMFDWAGIMPTEVVRVGGDVYLYYIGWSNRIDVPYHNSLGLAISSDDGKTFAKYSNGPVFSTSSLEPGFVGSVGILFEEDEFLCWYLSCRKWVEHDGLMEPYYDIKFATSKNGVLWEPKGVTCIGLLPGEGGIATPRVRKIGEEYHMWFSYRMENDFRQNPDRSYRIGHAVSNDGINWTRDPEPVLFPSGNKDDWDGIMTTYPYIIPERNRLVMFYNGNGFGKTGIGVASADYK